jgi:hypothetical protein
MSEESNWNKTKVILGLSIGKANVKPSDYITEIKVKKAVMGISLSMLQKFHHLRRPSVGFFSYKALSRLEIVVLVEKMSSEKLNQVFSVYEEDGIEEALYLILKIKKKK